MAFQVPPKELLTTCDLAKPPTREQMRNPLETFPEANDMYEAHVLLLNDYASRQTAAAGECRQQLISIKSWAETHLNLEVTP